MQDPGVLHAQRLGGPRFPLKCVHSPARPQSNGGAGLVPQGENADSGLVICAEPWGTSPLSHTWDLVSAFVPLGHGYNPPQDVPPECEQSLVCRLGSRLGHTFCETLPVLQVCRAWRGVRTRPASIEMPLKLA